MAKKHLKIIRLLLGLFISPLILAALASAVFLAIHLANGSSFSTGMVALVDLYQNLVPFLPYITGIPAILMVVAWLFKNRNWIQRRNRLQ